MGYCCSDGEAAKEQSKGFAPPHKPTGFLPKINAIVEHDSEIEDSPYDRRQMHLDLSMVRQTSHQQISRRDWQILNRKKPNSCRQRNRSTESRSTSGKRRPQPLTMNNGS